MPNGKTKPDVDDSEVAGQLNGWVHPDLDDIGMPTADAMPPAITDEAFLKEDHPGEVHLDGQGESTKYHDVDDGPAPTKIVPFGPRRHRTYEEDDHDYSGETPSSSV